MRRIALLASAIALLCSQAQADTLGIHAGYGNWNQDVSGIVQLDGSADQPGFIDRIDLQNTLGHDSTDGAMLWLAFEHPVPFLPNVKLARTEADSAARTVLTTGIDYGDISIPVSTTVNSQVDLSHTDYVLYYELLDNWFELDLGVDVKQFDGVASISGAGQNEFEEFDDYVPFLYTSFNFNLPLTGLKVGGEYSGISAGGARGQDYRVRIGYEFSFGLGIEAGQRHLTLEANDSDEEFTGDIEFKGTYVAATYHF